jgi:hypothetical protein
METYFVLVVTGLTSAGVWLAGRKTASISLRRATGHALETIGLGVLFFALNLLTGLAVSVASQLLDVAFISTYLSADITLLVLSFLQALVFQRWRAGVLD